MPGLEPDPQSPFGGFLQGATHGVSLALAIQNQKRALEEQRRKDIVQAAELRNQLGKSGDAIIQELAPDLAPHIFSALPDQSAEQRSQLTAAQAGAFNLQPSAAGMNPQLLTGVGQVLRGQAAKSQADTAWDALLRGDTKGMNDAADKEDANARAILENSMRAIAATPEEKANAAQEAQAYKQKAALYRNLALMMTKKGGALTLKDIQSQGFLKPTGTPTPNQNNPYLVK